MGLAQALVSTGCSLYYNYRILNDSFELHRSDIRLKKSLCLAALEKKEKNNSHLCQSKMFSLRLVCHEVYTDSLLAFSFSPNQSSKSASR